MHIARAFTGAAMVVRHAHRVQPQPASTWTINARHNALSSRQHCGKYPCMVNAAFIAGSPSQTAAWDPSALRARFEKAVAGINSEDPAEQSQSVVELANLVRQPFVCQLFESELDEEGIVQALSKALQSSDWDVKGSAAISLASLAHAYPTNIWYIARGVGVTEIVAMLQQLQGVTYEGWQALHASTLPEDITQAGALLLRLLARHDMAGVSLARAIPVLVHLLDVDSKEDQTRLHATKALQELVGNDSEYQDVVADAGAVEKLVALLDAKDIDLQNAAADTLCSIMKGNKRVQAMFEDSGMVSRLKQKRRHVSTLNDVLSRIRHVLR